MTRDLNAENDQLRKQLSEAQEAHRIIAKRLADYERSAPARTIQRVWRIERRLRDLAIQRRLEFRAVQRRLRRIDPRPTRTGPAVPLLDGSASAAELPEPVHLSPVDDPTVSIVMPVHGQLAMTAACLSSIQQASSSIRIQVIVVDDASPDDTVRWLDQCSGITRLSLDDNVGYLRATNQGATLAKASTWLCLLNNDTQVRPGWIEALTETAERDTTIGAVGAKLLYPNGQVQEAGGLVWSDASGHNVGRGGSPTDPAISHVRDVDYCSAACLLVDRNVWDALGGFDDRYAPAYYEDTDLAFRIRALGKRVVYQPTAEVIHHEGISHGTDTTSGGKAFQHRNRDTFAKRWHRELQKQPPRGSDLIRASWRGKALVLIVEQRLPTPNIDSASVRVQALIEAFCGDGHRVALVAADAVRREPYATRLEQLGVRVVCPTSPNEQTIRDLARAADLAIVSRPAVGATYLPVLAKAAPTLAIAYDMVDLHALRLRRKQTVEGRESSDDELIATEQRLVEAAATIIAITEEEAQMVRGDHPGCDVITIPNIHSAPRSRSSFSDRNGVLFVGSWLHAPNRDALRWLIDEIMPLVWATRSDITLHVVGSNLPDKLDIPAGANIAVHGWLPYLEPVFDQALVSVAPLRYGAGLKGKVGDSLVRGIPTVATAIAAEGFGPASKVLLLGETAEELAALIVQIHRDETDWKRRSNEGRDLILEHFGPSAAHRAVAELLTRARP